MENIIAGDDLYRNANRTLSLKDHSASEATPSSSGSFSLNPSSIAKWLIVIAVLVTAMSVVVGLAHNMTGYSSPIFSRLNKVFSLDLKLDVPSYLKTLLFLSSSVILAFISYFRRKQSAPFVHWAILSAGFFYMSFDEMAVVHQRLVEPVRSLMGGNNFGFFYFAWVVPAIIIVLVLGGAFLKFWWNLPAKTRLCTLFAGLMFLGGALGMEMLDGKYAEIHGQENLTYMWLTTIEEVLEISGLILLIYTLLDYIAVHMPLIELRLYTGNKASGSSV